VGSLRSLHKTKSDLWLMDHRIRRNDTVVGFREGHYTTGYDVNYHWEQSGFKIQFFTEFTLSDPIYPAIRFHLVVQEATDRQKKTHYVKRIETEVSPTRIKKTMEETVDEISKMGLLFFLQDSLDFPKEWMCDNGDGRGWK
jgi:hypothetical protein